eukprot:6478810-Amphidinium_carterae.1
MSAALGCEHHPRCLELLSQMSKGRSSEAQEQSLTYVSLSTCSTILHRTEVETMFHSQGEARKANARHAASRKRRRDYVNLVQAPKVPRTYKGIVARMIVDEIRNLDSASVFVTMPTPDRLHEGQGAYTLLQLRSDAGVLGGIHAVVGGDNVVDFSEDPLADALHSPTGLLAFRVLHGHPARFKHAPAPTVSGSMYSADALVITLHPVSQRTSFGAEEPWICLTAKVRPLILTGLASLSLQVLKEDVRVWSLTSEVAYSLPVQLHADSIRTHVLLHRMMAVPLLSKPLVEMSLLLLRKNTS